LKVNADGSITTTSTAPTIPTSANLINPTVTNLAAGAYVANRILSYTNTVAITTAGIYIIRPFFMSQYSVFGAVNMLLVKNGTDLDSYTSSLTLGSDTFAPANSDIATGLSGAWHNIANQDLGGAQGKSLFNNNQQFEYYLEVGTYKLAITVHTALTTTINVLRHGFEQFAPKV
jgi:hypothetical protein